MKKDKFLKLSMLQNWTDEIYKIESRNGPNTWRIINLDGTQPKKEQILYEVNIDFDEASREWKKNKKSIGNGEYKYINKYNDK